MTLTERIILMEDILDDIASTNSILQKQNIIEGIDEELKDDFECIVECLSGAHKFGYTYNPIDTKMFRRPESSTIREVIDFLLEPANSKDLSIRNISMHISETFPWSDFFGPIVNRTLKIGIGKSILPKDGLSAQLAKKYEGRIGYSYSGYYITEKLDGNRCIARWDGTKWCFTSRNGKEMHVNFDMGNLPKDFIYDGEILSPEQTAMSDAIYELVVNGQTSMASFTDGFSATSGLINRHDTNKRLVYNIFDIMVDTAPYWERRKVLDKLEFGGDTRLVRVLRQSNNFEELVTTLPNLLADITDMGGEGLMINLGDSFYEHTRSAGLLKMKKVQSIDMFVDDLQWGAGKYDGQVGALICSCKTDDRKFIQCNVGTGLSDDQRLEWAIHPERIVGKIVEVGYFSLSQTSADKGTNCYSLRFPRLKKVRTDKTETSEY